MTREEFISPQSLMGKTIDCHTHAGISLKAYSCMEYPYAQSLDDLYYRQKACHVNACIVFPLSSSLFFDPRSYKSGRWLPARRPMSEVPYGLENEALFNEVVNFQADKTGQFIPFACIDPGRKVNPQIALLRRLEKKVPIFGIKVSGVECQSRVTGLLGRGKAFLEFARERDIPVLFHTTCDPTEDYSRAELCLRVIEKTPDVRFCLAHCIGFHREFLKRATELPNVWVDTSAMKIQVQLAFEKSPLMASEADRFPADYSDHRKVTQALAQAYPDKLMWGTDSPAYTFICQRSKGKGEQTIFALKGSYEEEKAALNFLSPNLQKRIGNANILQFLYGPQTQTGGAACLNSLLAFPSLYPSRTKQPVTASAALTA